MEGYIKKINHKVVTNNDEKKQKKIKRTYQIVAGCILGVAIAGFLASFITFMVLFFHFKTDEAFTAWIVAVPFALLLIAGSVVGRIADMLLRDNVEREYELDKKRKEEKEQKKIRKEKQ